MSERSERVVDASASEPQQSLRRTRRIRVGAGDRPGDPRPAVDADEDVLPLPRTATATRRTPTSARSAWRTPGCCRSPNRAAVDQALRVGLALGCRDPGALQVGPQELLLSRLAQGVPDLPVRRAAVRRRQLPRARPRGRLRRRHRARAPRGGRREDGPRGGGGGRIAGSSGSIVDFNRAGTPLLEIVTEPDLHSPEQARRFLTCCAPRSIAIGASDCDMEKGSLRCRRQRLGAARGRDRAFGTKTELKNMNSFRFLERGIDGRDRAADRAAGGRRRASCRRRCTTTRRAAELSLAALEGGGARLPLLPRARPGAASSRPRELVEELRGDAAGAAGGPDRAAGRRRTACPRATAEPLGLNGGLTAYFEDLAARTGRPQGERPTGSWASSRRSSTRPASTPDESPVTPERLAGLVALVGDGTLGSTAAKQVFAALLEQTRAEAAELDRARSGSARSATSGRAGRDRRRGDRRAPRPRSRPTAAARQRCSASSSGQVMRPTGGRAEPKVVQAAAAGQARLVGADTRRWQSARPPRGRSTTVCAMPAPPPRELLLTPGPTPVPPDGRGGHGAAAAAPPLARVQGRVRRRVLSASSAVFRTERDVMLFTRRAPARSSRPTPTSSRPATACSSSRPATSASAGSRWREAYGADGRGAALALGRAGPTPTRWPSASNGRDDLAAVVVVHSETSTGVACRRAGDRRAHARALRAAGRRRHLVARRRRRSRRTPGASTSS